MKTPWGDGDALRDGMLRPGPGIPREDVARSQRERLFAATVVCVASNGYEATSVADLLKRSGVSRSAFYEHFRDKEDCLLATFEATVAIAMETATGELGGDGSPEERSRAAAGALLELIEDQPGAMRLCFEDIYMAGNSGRLAVDAVAKRFGVLAGELILEIGGERLPENLVHGLLGGAHSVVRSRLRDREGPVLSACVEDLWDWTLSYEAPRVPLRLAGRRSRPPKPYPPAFVAYSTGERIVRALAASVGERGYAAVTIAEIAGRASVSQATFYSHFDDKNAALVASLDSTGSQMLGMVLPAYRRAPDWPSSVRAAIGALCGFYASEPHLARLVAAEPYVMGPLALAQRTRSDDELRALLDPGFLQAPHIKPVVAEAALGAVWALLYAQIAGDGPDALPEIAPLASYVALAPFIGAEMAGNVARGDGRRS